MGRKWGAASCSSAPRLTRSDIRRFPWIPRPCGYRSDPGRACSCTPQQVEKYPSRISGPLLDRIDLHVEVPAVPFTQLAEMPPGPTSADLRAQVLEARARQAKRSFAIGSWS
ncbi:MAG: ATP-binding protein [Isosphaeraceae bacterium]